MRKWNDISYISYSLLLATYHFKISMFLLFETTNTFLICSKLFSSLLSFSNSFIWSFTWEYYFDINYCLKYFDKICMFILLHSFGALILLIFSYFKLLDMNFPCLLAKLRLQKTFLTVRFRCRWCKSFPRRFWRFTET